MHCVKRRNSTVVVFDGNCGFCTLAVNLLTLLGRGGRIRAVPCQSPAVPASLGLTREDCERAVWVIVDDRSYRGAEAIDVALARAIGVPPLARLYRLPVVRQTQDIVYGWVARHRARLPAITPYCQRHPEDCLQTSRP